MPDLIVRAWHWLLLLWPEQPRPYPTIVPTEECAVFLPAVPEPVPEPAPEAQQAKPDPPRAAAKPKLKPSDAYGQFFFREQILDQLDDYFTIVRRMRKFDPQAYALYSRIGAHIMPVRDMLAPGSEDQIALIDDKPVWARLSPWWRQNRPSFGAVALVHPTVDKTERASLKKHPESMGKMYPRFAYFTKFSAGKAPCDVQPVTSGDIYVVTFYFHDKILSNKPDTPIQFPVHITPDGQVRVLNTLLQSYSTIRVRKRSRRYDSARSFTIPNQRWGIRPELAFWAHDNELPTHACLQHLFIMAANAWEAAQYSMIRIDVRQASMHAVFGVDVQRTPYFFRDRAVTVGDTGRRKRIFHIVRGHVREDGARVKTHFRGERRFEWNGYEVNISVPGKHHSDLADASFGAVSHDGPRLPGTISDGHFGHLLQKHIAGETVDLHSERV